MKILAATDLSDDTKPVLDFAAQLAQKCQSKMYLLHLLPIQLLESTNTIFADDNIGNLTHQINPIEEMMTVDDTLLEIADNRTKQLAHEISRQWQVPIYGKAEISEDIVKSILDFCERHQVDMFVVGNRHHSLLSSLFLGGTPEKLMRQTRIPMAIVPCDLDEEK